jgi:hypothetical protein
MEPILTAMRSQRAVSRKKGRQMTFIRRFVAVVGLAAALSGALLAAPNGAGAHGLDAYHQHGWNELYALEPGVHAHCTYFNGSGILRFDVPDLMTTPGGTRRVYFRAFLQYYDYSRGSWVGNVWNGSRWVDLPYLNWQYADATDRGLVNGYWRDFSTNTYTPVNYPFAIARGYWYRVNVEYFWGYDGTDHFEATNYCRI